MQCASVNAKENEAGESPPLPASNVPQRSRLRRTLLFAGVFALLAMIWVPTPKYGYRLILDRSDTSIAFFQLLANVAFAALVGAIAANLPKRALRVVNTTAIFPSEDRRLNNDNFLNATTCSAMPFVDAQVGLVPQQSSVDSCA